MKKPTDPGEVERKALHVAMVAVYCEAFDARYHQKYRFAGPVDGSALKRFIAAMHPGITSDQFRDVLVWALRSTGPIEQIASTGLSSFVSQWNRIVVAKANASGAGKHSPW